MAPNPPIDNRNQIISQNFSKKITSINNLKKILLVGAGPRLGKGETLGGSLTGDHGSLVTAGAADAPAEAPQGSNCCCGGCVCCCTGIPQGSTLDEAAASKIKVSSNK